MSARVAQRKPTTKNGQSCRVCSLTVEALQVVNAAIWDGTTERVRNYRERGVEAYQLITGDTMEVRSITRHAEHIEATWFDPSEGRPARHNEVEVFPADYESLVDTAANLSARAMGKLTEKVDTNALTNTELLQAAKIGVSARGQQEATKVASKQPQIQLTAIFGLASGHLADLPESEAIDVTPERELLDAVHEERRALEEHARGS